MCFCFCLTSRMSLYPKWKQSPPSIWWWGVGVMKLPWTQGWGTECCMFPKFLSLSILWCFVLLAGMKGNLPSLGQNLWWRLTLLLIIGGAVFVGLVLRCQELPWLMRNWGYLKGSLSWVLLNLPRGRDSTKSAGTDLERILLCPSLLQRQHQCARSRACTHIQTQN